MERHDQYTRANSILSALKGVKERETPVVKNYLITEVKITDPKVSKEIDAFAKLKVEQEKLRAELAEVDKELKEYAKTVIPLLEQLKDVTAQTENYMIKITRKGYEQEKKQYKIAFETALTKVNAQTKKVLVELLAEHTNMIKVNATVSATKKENQELDESIRDAIVSAIKKIKAKVASWITEIRKISVLNKALEKLAKEAG